MNDIDRARKLRELAATNAASDRTVKVSEWIVANLPADLPTEQKCVALLLALLGIADTAGVDRDDLIDTFEHVIETTPEIEIAGLL